MRLVSGRVAEHPVFYAHTATSGGAAPEMEADGGFREIVHAAKFQVMQTPAHVENALRRSAILIRVDFLAITPAF